MKINIKPNCGNSPKKELLKELTILFASYELEKVKQNLEEDIEWKLIGDEPIIGKEKFIAALEKMSDNKAVELTIHNIITHGKGAALNGEMKMKNGNIFGFSDFYEFSSATAKKIKCITSYVILIN